MRLFFKAGLLSFALMAGRIALYGQQVNTDNPNDLVWVKMMEDPNVNYYAAVKAYNEYWKTHPKPEDPEDRLKGHDKDRDKDEEERPTLSPEQKRLQDRLIYQIKRFETWMHEEKPFVQDDGHILTEQERKEMWQKEQEEKNKSK